MHPRCERLVFWGVILLAVVGGLAFLNPYLDSDGDNAAYLMLAKSIATGRGFTSINFPDYVPQTQYNPFYPLVLAPIVTAWPGDYLLPKLPSLLFTAVLVAAVWALFKRRTSSSLLTLGLLTAAVAINRYVAEHAAATMTEAPYLAASFLALAWAEAKAPDARGRDGIVLGGVLAVAYMTKPVGVTLVAAALVAWLLRRRWAAVLVAALIVLSIAGGWAYRNRAIVTPENAFDNPSFGNTGYSGQVFARESYRPEAGRMGLAEFLRAWPLRVLANFDGVARVGHPAYTFGITVLGKATAPPLYYPIPLLALMLIGWVRCVRREAAAAELYMLFYLGAATIYPAVRVRYVLPIMPLALFYLVRGTDAVIGWIRRRPAPVIGPAGVGGTIVLAAAVLLNVLLVARQARFTWADNFGPRGAANLYDRIDRGADAYFRAVDWIAARTARDAVIMGTKPFLTYLRSGHHATVYSFSYDPRSTADVLQRHRVDYLIADGGWHWHCRSFLEPVLKVYPDAFELIHSEPDPETNIYRVHRAALPPRRAR